MKFNLVKVDKGWQVFTKDLEKLSEEYMIYGGYPRVVLADSAADKINVLQNIYSTFFLREVKDLAGLIETEKIQKLIITLALIQGNLIEYKKLSEATGYSFASVKKYLRLLEATYIIGMVRPYFKNKIKEITKSPKIYFLDPGLRNVVINDFRSYELRVDKGGALEAVTFGSIRRKNNSVHFWRDKAGNEIDFVVEGIHLRPDLFECKWNYDDFHPGALKSFLSLYKNTGDKKIISFKPSKNKNSLAIWQFV